jgi:post-segregation antitoxin (ccd killing protein)
MLRACYGHAVSTLQVKNLPEELHAALAARAKSEGVTMSEFVTRTLHKELSRPTMAEWVERRRAHAGPLRDIDTLAALDAARDDYDPDERFPPR